MILLQTALLLLLYGEGLGRRLISQVTAPKLWRLGVPESVFIRAFQQSESCSVKVSVVSYPDKTTTFCSALLRLTPENHFQGAVTLSITAEDSPREFVYLVVESEVFREETRIPVSGAAQNPRDQSDKTAVRRRRRRSAFTEEEIKLTGRFKNSILRQCCRDGIDHYSQHLTCKNESNEEVKRSKPKCYQAYKHCCTSIEDLQFKPMVMAMIPEEVEKHIVSAIDLQAFTLPPLIGIPERFPAIRTHEEEEVIRITVTQTTSSGTVNTTFTVKVDPTNDVSVQLSSKMFETHIAVSARTPPPADGYQ